LTLETPHLLLRPHAPQEILALIERPDQFTALTGFPAAPGLREFFVSGEISPTWFEQLRMLQQPEPWILGFGVIDKESRSMVGMAGYKGAPDTDGIVEVAYGIVPSFEGRGYATEATRALIEYAVSSGLARRIRAHTLPAANASTHVLKKCGFDWVGEVVDPEDGLVWRWERAATISSG
jgi:ribosomal-protein-alanine N-acetyltransferase